MWGSAGFAGPGGELPFMPTSDFYIMVGDLLRSAISAQLEAFDESDEGIVFLHVPDASCKLSLKHPPGFNLVGAITGRST